MATPAIFRGGIWYIRLSNGPARLEVAAIALPNEKNANIVDLGGTTLPGAPADLRKLIADETEKWARVVKFSGAKPD